MTPPSRRLDQSPLDKIRTNEREKQRRTSQGALDERAALVCDDLRTMWATPCCVDGAGVLRRAELSGRAPALP
jgi:hypothetical protein